MEHVRQLLEKVATRLEAMARGNAVVGKPVSLGPHHVVPLCELKFGFGGGGGSGEGGEEGQGEGKGTGGGAGGGARVTPVAVLVIENGKARLEKLGR